METNNLNSDKINYKLIDSFPINAFDIKYIEVKLYNAFCKSCNIEKSFNVDEYEDVTLSGPNVNPEDLMNAMWTKIYENKNNSFYIA